MKAILYTLLIGVTFIACNKTGNTSQHLPDADIDKLKSNDVQIGKPQPGDWLESHLEPGQIFEKYIKSNPVSPDEQHKKIYLQPLGTFTSIQKAIILHTSNYLSIFFNLETIVLPTISESSIPSSARRIHWSGHEQLLTTYILDNLQLNIPHDAIVIMAITSKDLYPSDNWNFVFGQARTKKRVGLSSIYRFSTEPLDSSNYTICLERLIKTSSHEIGHMFTCQHCTYAICVMNGSNSLWESDERPNRLCTDCLRKLQWNLGFAVKPRLSSLKKFFAMHKLKQDYRMAIKDWKLLENDSGHLK